MTTLKPPTCLLMGPAGCGKTSSLPSYVEAGKELFVIVTEPNGVDSLIDACKLHNVPLDKVHWHTVSPVTAGWDAMKDMAHKVKTHDYEAITKIKAGVGKEHQQQLMKLLEALENFHDERTGKEFGDVTEWGDDKAFVIDSLTGINRIARDHTVGYKPSMHQGEWGTAMNLVESLIFKLTSDVKCFMTICAHIDRVQDEITGVGKITLSTLGNKLAPKLTPLFSEVIIAKRDPFLWSTTEANHELKNRALPISDRIEPSFVQIVHAYEARRAAMAESLTAKAS